MSENIAAVEAQQNPRQALKKFFGFTAFKGEQEAIIQNILDGNDSFVIMPTGGGKSLCYQLPALMMEGTAIVVSPLIALMKNQVDAIRGFSADDGVAHFLNSSLNKSQLAKVKEDVVSGVTKMLYVAPESLTKDENVEFLNSVKISFFAIDEAHCISEWGHDFRPEYRRLKPIMKEIADTPVIALTATATEKVQLDILKNLGRENARVFKASFNRDNLYYEVRPKENVFSDIIKFIKKHEGKSGIVYCLSRKKVEELAEALRVNGIKALAYHAGMESSARARTQDQFLMEDVDVIVATIAFGMGIDKPDVRYVIHHDIPKSIESYYQETGRAGRDGGEGKCLAFYSYKDIEKLEKFLQGKPVAEQEIGKQLLQDIVSYAETSVCRRKFLLYYFGEEFDEARCTKMCDNCAHPKESVEVKEDLTLILETVKAVKEKHQMKHVVNVLIGKETADVKTYNHHQLEQFGAGDDQEPSYWNSIIRHCLVSGILTKEIETYGQLKLSPLGQDFLKSPRPIKLFLERSYASDPNESVIGGAKAGNAGDPVLMDMLKDLRKKEADKRNLAPYIIFQESSLEDMAIRYPITMDELINIAGVGSGKANKFGKPFIDLIAKYVKENEIDRPMDMVVRSVANKSANKVHIITNIDKRLPLEDIASSKGMDMEQIVSEIEAIVYSGTKVNINYYLDDLLDEDSQEEIFEYFKEAEDDSIDAAVEEFDGDFSDEELRLMRIRFLSEVAN
ncbi:MAG: DNA helicase RecQ [Flavobacteriales bacterium]|nr:DNA helicase RecQ [Flavobacteriales bacterium]